MAVAFTEFEVLTINNKLKSKAKQYMITKGVKATTVETLADEAGISKGAFYRFYDSKELLFFELLKDGVDGVFKELEKLDAELRAMTPTKKLELTILMAVVHADGLLTKRLLETELEIMLKKLPQIEVRGYLHALAGRTQEFLSRQNTFLNCAIEDFLKMIYIHILSLANREKIGSTFDEVLQVMIRGTAMAVV